MTTIRNQEINTILVLGGDGYIGWPLAMRLTRLHPKSEITIVDNLSRRKWVAESDSDSLTPIGLPLDRVEQARAILGVTNLQFVELDVSEPSIDDLVRRRKPDLIYHLSQQASAGYSMSGPEQSITTAVNNETANLRLLWAIRRHVPECHLVKLGSFGEYCHFGLDIAEGFFEPTYNSKKAPRPAPYPRAADDIYHVSKINDSNYISMACRKWGLKVTEVMQSTVFGLMTEEIRKSPTLATRFDYDTNYGTVMNRFTVQAALSLPLTVYGTGWQRTGLMALEDAVVSLASMATDKMQLGQHRIINHVGETDLCIRDIADAVSKVAISQGLEVRVSCGESDPRTEQTPAKESYLIETPWLTTQGFKKTPLDQVIRETLGVVKDLKGRIKSEVLAPARPW